MSSARRRGQARGQGPADNSGDAPRRGNPSRGRVAPFDGPASRGSQSGAGNQSQVSGPTSTSRRSSNAGKQSTSTPGSPTNRPQAVQGDPARDPATATRRTDAVKNVDMPASFYNLDGLYTLSTELAQRPGFNQSGRTIQLPTNSYAVTAFPTRTVYQYDVIIGNGAEKRAVIKKAWYSQERQKSIKRDFIFDGNKLGWSLTKYPQTRMMVDLDVEDGKPSKGDGSNSYRVHVTPSTQVNLSLIEAYLQGKYQADQKVLEGINFLDHLLREGPSQNNRLVGIKRSFFARDGERADLGGSVEAFRGVYQSMRPAQGGKMVINVDVANTTFWRPQSLLATVGAKNKWRDANQVAQRLSTNAGDLAATAKYLRKLSVKASYKGNPQPNTVYKIDGVERATAKTHTIEYKAQGQDKTQKITVEQYFQRRYNVNLQFPTMPLVRMTKKFRGTPVMFPFEFLQVVEHQRYATKLDETQTANMIKFAVSPPAARAKSIQAGKDLLEWPTDAHLNNYGLQINSQPVITQARILPPPMVMFGKGKAENVGTKGRWDLRGKAFFSPNPQALKSWGIGVFSGGRMNLNKGQIDKFALDFCKQYRGHGGQITNPNPHIVQLPADAGQAVEKLWQETGTAFQQRPQILVFILQDRNSQHYLRIKKSCDIRYGVVSQCMQAAQVAKCNPQYISNVLMKFNAKLGGSTAIAKPDPKTASKTASVPTVFIGADVSHASPGSDQPSMAALTVSYDKNFARYVAACQTNGVRVEMITEKNMNLLGPLLQKWTTDVGGGRPPVQVYYMRDGVSEGQFIKVINEEVPFIRNVLNKISGGKWNGKITALAAGKRHHIRAFPKGPDGDQKGNPLPGTLIEKDVTSALDFDFYLYSHIALQGTSKPVHYTVLIDEAKHDAGALQNMVYEHCYQYMRSTTSVSLHPAVYYAHLASNRAKAHENIPASAGPQGGSGYKQNQPSSSSDRAPSSEAPDLLPMTEGNVKFTMWYI